MRSWYCGTASIALVVAVGCSSQSAGPGPGPDLILYNGNILTADDTSPTAQAVAITAGKFTAVGGTEEIRRLAGDATHQADLGGRTVTPGTTVPTEAIKDIKPVAVIVGGRVVSGTLPGRAQTKLTRPTIRLTE